MKNPGQMLIEIVVAIGVLALVFLGIADLMTRSANLVSYQRERDVAYAFARKKLNEYREQRDKMGTLFFSNLVLVDGPCEENSTYYCKASYTETPDQVLGGKVTLKLVVTWSSGNEDKTYQVSAEEVLVDL